MRFDDLHPRDWGKPACPFIVAGPCVLEDETTARLIAKTLMTTCHQLGCRYIFKASFDKANRSSANGYRGPGMSQGLKILADIRSSLGVMVLTDIHNEAQVAPAADAVDILQIPAFLCRQTDLLLTAGRTGSVINVKKGQFMSPWDMANVIKKINSTGNDRIILTERGFSFGYNNLVVDFRSLPVMRQMNVPVIFDATHSVQLPGGAGTASSGESQFVPTLSAAAVAAGTDGLFFEVHPNPSQALCDGPNSIALHDVEPLLRRLMRIAHTAHEPEG